MLLSPPLRELAPLEQPATTIVIASATRDLLDRAGSQNRPP
jgi:hypothetical protein